MNQIKPLVTTIFIAGSTLSSIQVATASPAHFVDNGYYTTDSRSGLDWLDVTETVNMSYNQVTAQLSLGGSYAGWRYATGIEFNTMIKNYTETAFDVTATGEVIHNEGLLDTLHPLLGSTLDSFWIHDSNTTYDAKFGKEENQYHDITRGFIHNSLSPSSPGLAFINDNDKAYFYQDTTVVLGSGINPAQQGYDTGSFLVRNTVTTVPLPPTAGLLAFGLFGLAGFSHKKKSLSVDV